MFMSISCDESVSEPERLPELYLDELRQLAIAYGVLPGEDGQAKSGQVKSSQGEGDTKAAAPPPPSGSSSVRGGGSKELV